MKLFELFATLGLDTGQFDKGIDASVSKGEDAKNKVSKSFGLLKGAIVAAGAVIAVKRIGDAFTSMGEKADAIDENSQKIGLSRKAYQEWGYVLSQNGGNIESFGVGMKTLQNAMAQGTEATDAAFKTLGLNTNKLKSMTPEDALAATIKAFQTMPAGAEKSALAMDLFGKQGMELLPTLNSSAEATDTLKKRAHDLGLVLSDEAIDAGGKFSDNMSTLKLGLGAVGTNIIAKLMPAVSKFIEKLLPLISRIFPKLTEAFGKIFEAIAPVAEIIIDALVVALEWVADNINTLLPIVGVLIALFTAWQVVQLALNLAMLANPITLIVLGVAALIAGIVLLIQNFDAVKAWLAGIGQWVYDNVILPVGAFFEGLWSAISGAAATAWEAIVSVWTAVSTWFNDNIIVPVAGFFSGLWTGISTAASDVWTAIVGVWTTVSTWFNDNIITPVSSAFSAFWLTVSGLFSTLWGWVKGVWEGASTWFNNTVIKPVAGFFSGFWNTISSTAKKTWEDIVKWISNAIEDIKEFLGLVEHSSGVHVTVDTNGRSKTYGGSGAGFATGIDSVPYEGDYHLHPREAVLTASEANEWRKGGNQTTTQKTINAPMTIYANDTSFAEQRRVHQRGLEKLALELSY